MVAARPPERPVRVLALAQSELFSGAEDVFAKVVGALASGDEELVAALPAKNAAFRDALRRSADLALLDVPSLPTRWPALRVFQPQHVMPIIRLLRRTAPHALLINLPSAEHGGGALTVAAALGIPSVGLVHVPHTPVQMGARLSHVRTLLTRIGTRRADVLCALSPTGMDLVRRNWSGPRTEVRRFRLPRQRFTAYDRDAARRQFGLGEHTVVGLAGRVALVQKGHHIFVDAAKILTGQKRSYRFAIAGAGPDEARLRRLVAERGMDDSFLFCGHVQIEEFLAAIDLLAMPSFFEGVPLVALQALAAGTACVASAIPGLTEIWPADWQVPSGDAHALADAIERVLGEPPDVVRSKLEAAAAVTDDYMTDDPSGPVRAALAAVTGREVQGEPRSTRHRDHDSAERQR